MDAPTEALRERGLVLGPVIGKGTFGHVYQATSVRNQRTYAIKVINTRRLRMQAGFDEDKLMREVFAMRQIRHPSFVELMDAFSSPEALFIVMELVVGIDLFDLIVAKNGLDELAAKFLFRQLASALAFMHSRGIVHRDVKPENVIVYCKDERDAPAVDTGGVAPGTRIKIIDFGLAKSIGEQTNASFVGTPKYLAPEIAALAGGKGRTLTTSESVVVDSFAAGVLLFVMLECTFPNYEKDDDGADRVRFEPDSAASPEARDLVHALTRADPAQRVTLAAALDHPFLTGAARTPEDELAVRPSAHAESAVAALSGLRLSLATTPSTPAPDLSLLPHIEASLLQSFSLVHTRAAADPSLSALLRTGFVHCRNLVSRSQLLLSRMGNTGMSVLQLAPDVSTAVAEGETDAAVLELMLTWVRELSAEARALIEAHGALAKDVGDAIEAVRSSDRALLDMDRQVVRLALMWRSIDLALSVLRQKLDALVALLPQTHNAKLRERFLARLNEMTGLWQGVVRLCQQVTAQATASEQLMIEDAATAAAVSSW